MKVLKVAAISVAIATASGVVGYQGQKLQSEYELAYTIVTANDSMNKESVWWHENDENLDAVNKTHTVTDAQGVKFDKVPLSASNEEFIKHFGSRKEWKGHLFFGSEYNLNTINKDGTNNPVNPCVPWDVILPMKTEGMTTYNTYDEVQSLRNDYIKQCGWNKDVNMSFTDDKSVHMYKLGGYMQFMWFGLIALLGTVPALWVGFWRGVGVAIRTAKKEAFKKD
ncbi:hypothetical protein LD024_13215 [Citrobacter werkmanii]|uniref:hypothetical protein n=1 Tax=Citrobacter werkmanii TaxID=67827 RepID=UPI001D0BBB88|nr:hypothetical protein [Citrobacter werkmanii]UBX42936.1 hypothetical protein LD024_13215 [Citrobacter werkmanii]